MTTPLATPLAIAATSGLAADAGEAIARAGGNAVDAAIAAMLVSINTEPGVCSLACGGYMTIWQPGEAPLTLDGYVAAPGAGMTLDPARRNATDIYLEYGGGITTTVGPDSVGVPGGVALFGEGSKRYGKLPWKELFTPAIETVQRGFPLPEASYNYLVYSGKPIFGRSPDGYEALYTDHDELRKAGETIHVPHLADSLAQIAEHGPDDFYTGEIGQAITNYLNAAGGRLNQADMRNYNIISRPSLQIEGTSPPGKHQAGEKWTIATNPPPAVGGIVLAAMLKMMNQRHIECWDDESFQYLLDVQQAALGYRTTHLDLSDRIEDDARRLLDLAERCAPATVLESGSTCHTSAVDATGLACSLTVSSGYGAGDMPPDTGIWLNNCLGELELNKRGLDIGPPGTRLPSNMAPTVARSERGTVLSIGSPGASRITTATLQVLINHIHLGMPLREAIAHPRAHVELDDEHPIAACEPGLPVDAINMPSRQFEHLSMYFGGVGAASWSSDAGFAVAADPRRTGGTWSGP
jgi:gamma-glutamyltranspeptidase/glutathione hydrolase